MKRCLSVLVLLVFVLACSGTVMAAEQKVAPPPTMDKTVTDNTATDNNTMKKVPAPLSEPSKK